MLEPAVAIAEQLPRGSRPRLLQPECDDGDGRAVPRAPSQHRPRRDRRGADTGAARRGARRAARSDRARRPARDRPRARRRRLHRLQARRGRAAWTSARRSWRSTARRWTRSPQAAETRPASSSSRRGSGCPDMAAATVRAVTDGAGHREAAANGLGPATDTNENRRERHDEQERVHAHLRSAHRLPASPAASSCSSSR